MRDETTRRKFVVKLVAIDRPATCSIPGREITALAHKVWNDPMKERPFEAKALLASAKRPKILGRDRAHAGKEVHLHPASRLATNLNVKPRIGGARLGLLDRHGRAVRRSTTTTKVDEGRDLRQEEYAEHHVLQRQVVRPRWLPHLEQLNREHEHRIRGNGGACPLCPITQLAGNCEFPLVPRLHELQPFAKSSDHAARLERRW
mmetsp:Transcript_37681/g.98733  ORF Transcript_37681/g.98733 Transcript_37681/m.98733 type:complete len:204 (+) Transcript_37681:61-672(+)